MAELNEIIRERLIKIFSGETQEVTARKLNTTQSNVSKWKSGQQVPTTDMVYEIANKYKVSVDWLLGISDEPEIDGLVLEKLTYEQIAKVLDRLIKYNTIEIPNLVAVMNDKELYVMVEKGDDDVDGQSPIYDSDYIKIKDRLLAFIMRRRQLLTNPELNMLDVWWEKLAPFHKLNLLEYSETLEQAIDARSPAQFNEGDWGELMKELSGKTIKELQEIVSQIKKKEGNE